MLSGARPLQRANQSIKPTSKVYHATTTQATVELFCGLSQPGFAYDYTAAHAEYTMSYNVGDIFLLASEAGTHFTGQADAPDFILDQGGLENELRNAGFCPRVQRSPRLQKGGDLHEAARWMPQPKINGVRNLQNTLRVLEHVKQWLMESLSPSNDFAIFLGGDCTLTIPTLTAFQHCYRDKRAGLMYVDGDADLTLPSDGKEDGTSGILDSTVMSHLTQRPGSIPSFSALSGEGRPLITPENVVLFGFDPLQLRTEHWVYLVESGLRCFTRPTVANSAKACAQEALAWLEQQCDVVLLHFDVDVIDAGTFPLANYPHYAGLSVDDALDSLRVFLGSEKVKGLILTEINPNRDKDGRMTRLIAEGITRGLAQRAVGET